MALDRLKNSQFPTLLSDVAGDIADLVQKELRLAKAEVTRNIASKINAGVWFAVAGVLGLVVFILALQALVFGIASRGIALHWSCLIVAAACAVIAGAAFVVGRQKARSDLAPTRAIHQIGQDLRVAKEQLT
jgi:hypothetical protein